MALLWRIRSVLVKIAGYLVPLVQQIPTLGIYVGLMTLPLLAFLVILFTQFPMNLVEVISEFIMMSVVSLGVLIANLVTICGLLLALSSVIYLQRNKKHGLVTTGPYRFIRHPQYTGFLLLTLGLTAFSYWWLSNTFGIGWLSKEATVALWFVQLGIYVGLALLEESHLAKEFGEQYHVYKNDVSFLLPIGRTRRFDIPLSIGIMILIMFGVVLIQLPVFILVFP